MWRGAPRPRPIEWRSAAIVGVLLLLGGNGLVVWAEQTVPSGIAALIVSSVPLFMVALDWLLGESPAAGGDARDWHWALPGWCCWWARPI